MKPDHKTHLDILLNADAMKVEFEKCYFKNERHPEDCWPWGEFIRKDGYGWFVFEGKRYLAHVVAYVIQCRIDLEGRLVLHHNHCNKRHCVNFHHLYVGTYGDNAIDRVYCGKHNFQKLSIDQVREIKRLLNAGVRGVDLVKQFNTSPTTISDIKNGKSWQHLNV